MSMGNFVLVVSRVNVMKIPFDGSDMIVEINSLNYFLNVPKTTVPNHCMLYMCTYVHMDMSLVSTPSSILSVLAEHSVKQLI